VALKAKTYYMSRGDRRRSFLRRKGVILASILCFAAFCMAAYFCFFHGYMGNTSLACNIPSDSFSASAGSGHCANSGEADAQSCPVACQEISEVTDQGDTLLSLMNDNIADEASARLVATKLASLVRSTLEKADRSFDADTPLEAGKRYSVTVDPQGAFLRATIEMEPANVFHAAMQQGIVRCWKDEVVLDFKVESLQFTVKGGLDKTIAAAGERQELASKLANVFRWDINFQTDSRNGDTCKVLFERRYADDRPSGYGNILCAVYSGKRIGRGEEGNTGRKTAILFNGKYYDDKGVALKKDFLRSPLKIKLRVTSGFGGRFHPIRKTWHRHKGVDYGAPEGTPVLAVANGVVTFAGWNNGYGNYVCIKHDNGPYESRYGHLQRYFVKEGERVKQQQRIGLVGMTGVATGPHLDFQLLANNKHIDPQGKNVKMATAPQMVPAGLRSRFVSVTNERLAAFGRLAFTGSLQAKAFDR
jgi:murein DD-endopeptidase MepM/ murein hydrolase activator NlpD